MNSESMNSSKRQLKALALLAGAIPALVGIVIGLAVALSTSTAVQQNSCEKINAGFDIGSGSTKFVVAKVDVCKNRLITIIDEDSAKISYQDDLEHSKDESFSEATIAEGISTLAAFKKRAELKGAVGFQGFATEAFRKAKNGEQVAQRLTNETGIKIIVVPQSEETKLGRAGVSAVLPRIGTRFAVWDVGGGSQEFSIPNQNGTIIGFESKLASVNFKNLIISEIEKKNSDSVKSPNPISSETANLALNVAESVAGQITDEVRLALTQPEVEVVGIGGVHWFSLRGQTGQKEIYTQEDVEAALASKIGKSDSEIPSKFAETEVSNLILILGHMKSLGIKQVRPARVSLAISALF